MTDTKKRSCYECDHSGMDMDMEPYCAHPKVCENHPFGLVLHSRSIVNYCPAPDHPLWEVRKK